MHSIFLRTLLIILVLATALILLFYQYAARYYQDSYRQSVLQSKASVLKAVGNTAAVQLVSLETQISEFFMNPDCGHLLVSQDAGDTQDMGAIVLDLYNLCRRNQGIRQMWFYTYMSQRIFTSEKQAVSQFTQEQSELLAWYDQLREQRGMVENQLYLLNGELYWVQGYPEEKPLAVSFSKIEPGVLLEQILPATEESVLFYLDGQAVFPEELDYPDRSALQVGWRGALDENTELAASPDRHTYFVRYQTDLPGLQLVSVVERTALEPSVWDMLGRFWSYGLLACLLVLAAVFALMRHTLLPVRHLLEIIQPSEMQLHEGQPQENEIGILQRAYLAQQDREAALENLVQQVSTSVNERLISRAARGEVEHWENFREMLRQIHSPFANCRWCFAVLLTWSGGGGKDELKAELCRFELRQLTARYWEGACMCLLRWQDDQEFLILAGENPQEGGKLLRRVPDFAQWIAREAQKLSVVVQTEVGKSYEDLSQLADSCRDALQSRQERAYYAASSGDVRSDGTEPGILQAVRAWCAHPEEGEVRWNELEDQLSRSSEPCRSCLASADEAMEYAMQQGVAWQERWTKLRDEIKETPSGQEEEACRLLHRLFQEMEQPLQEAQMQEQNSHLARAQQIVARQYHNSGLSLQLVADQCGISTYYLSRLFKQDGGGGFTDYLNGYRIERAKQLLEHSGMTVTDIGYKTGFNSAQSFIRVFKKHEGETPGQYRLRKQRR